MDYILVPKYAVKVVKRKVKLWFAKSLGKCESAVAINKELCPHCLLVTMISDQLVNFNHKH